MAAGCVVGGAVLLTLGLFFVALTGGVELAFSQVLPPGISLIAAICVVVICTALLVMGYSEIATRIGSLVVESKSRTRGHQAEWVGREALPARLAGVGRRADRFNTALVAECPELALFAITAGDLRKILEKDLYVVVTKDQLEIWERTRLAHFSCVMCIALVGVESIRFIDHDPDLLGRRDQYLDGAVGTLDFQCAAGWHLYFVVRRRPKVRYRV
ncbi:MAG: hypothetical protein ACRDP6_14040 [Actinoallomurus sp.]